MLAWKKPVARIAVRYGAATLASWGVFGEDMAAQLADDPEAVRVAAIIVASVAAMATEAGYVMAKRWGGDT